MYKQLEQQSAGHPERGATTAREAVAGKRTLVEALAEPPVQQRVIGTGERANADVHAAAARGIAAPSSPLPYADRIQRLFGRHDISAIQAHTGADATASARAMGAGAYATGTHVVLGDNADLHTVAHEAAHVVQQRAGVQLQGGVGRHGDVYEQQADAVADLVVQGTSAAGLLDAFAASPGAVPASSPGASSGVQRVIQDDSGRNLTTEEALGAVAARLETTTTAQDRMLVERLATDPGTSYRVEDVVGQLRAARIPPANPSGAPSTLHHPSSESTGQFARRGTSNKPRNFRKRPEPEHELAVLTEETAVTNPKKAKAMPEPPSRRRASESEDSPFVTWIKAEHSDKLRDWEQFDFVGTNAAIADRDGRAAVVHILGSNAGNRENLLRAMIELHGKVGDWDKVSRLVRHDRLADYLGSLDAAVQHLNDFGSGSVAYYGRAALDALGKGSNAIGEGFFKAARVTGDGVLHGGHLDGAWEANRAALSGVAEDWRDAIGGYVIVQYSYRDKAGEKKVKTVFPSVHAGNELLNKAVMQGIRNQSARAAGRWEIHVQLDGGHQVRVVFNGSALQHIT